MAGRVERSRHCVAALLACDASTDVLLGGWRWISHALTGTREVRRLGGRPVLRVRGVQMPCPRDLD